MTYEKQYQDLKIVAKQMLLEVFFRLIQVGVVYDRDFDVKVSDMAISILEDLYNQSFSEREINNAIVVLKTASRF